jgi:predicted permease
MATMRTPIIAGREFDETDDNSREPVTLVNQSLAELLWPGQDPIGQPLMNGNYERRVIGVVADVRHLSVEESAGPEFYLALLQQGSMSPSVVVRTSRPFSDVAPALRGALRGVVSDLPTSNFTPLDQVVDRALSGRRFFVDLLIAFAAAALLLAAIGIYGVIAYSVTRRTAEIGIRMALGATAAGVRASVVNDTLRLTFVGIGIGLVSAVALSSLMTSLLYDVSPSDPATFLAAAGVLLLVAVAAGFIPAARASRISPISALRAD